MLDLRNKCYIDPYDIEIYSEQTYAEGHGLIQIVSECILINEEKPQGELTIHFTDWNYGVSINKADNVRIAKLLHDLGFDREFVENIHDYAC